MIWYIFALISVLSISVANIYQRVVMKERESDPLGSAIVFQFLLAAITGVFALWKGFVAPPIYLFPFNFVISAVFYAGGTLALFYAAKRIEASEITIISSLGMIVTILVAIIFLHESFTFIQGIGTIMILLSVFFVQNKIGISANKGTFFAALGTSLYAVAVVSDTYILKRYDAISYAPVMSVLPGIVLLIIQPRVIYRIKNILSAAYLKNMFLYGFFYGIQSVTYYLALSLGANASRMAPISRSQIILTVILGAIVLHERKHIVIKLLGAVIVTFGILLLA